MMFKDVDPPAGTPTGHNMREVAQENPDSHPTFTVLSASLRAHKLTTPDPLCTQHTTQNRMADEGRGSDKQTF